MLLIVLRLTDICLLLRMEPVKFFLIVLMETSDVWAILETKKMKFHFNYQSQTQIFSRVT